MAQEKGQLNIILRDSFPLIGTMWRHIKVLHLGSSILRHPQCLHAELLLAFPSIWTKIVWLMVIALSSGISLKHWLSFQNLPLCVIHGICQMRWCSPKPDLRLTAQIFVNFSPFAEQSKLTVDVTDLILSVKLPWKRVPEEVIKRGVILTGWWPRRTRVVHIWEMYDYIWQSCILIWNTNQAGTKDAFADCCKIHLVQGVISCQCISWSSKLGQLQNMNLLSWNACGIKSNTVQTWSHRSHFTMYPA